MLYPKSNCFLFNMPRITWITGLKHHEPPLLPKGFWINGFWSQRSLKALFQKAAASVRQSVRQVEPVTPCHSEIVPSWSYSCYSWPKSRISTSRQSWLKYVEFDIVWPCFDPVGISWPDPGCMFGLIKEVSSQQGKQISPDLQSTRCLRASVGNPDLHALIRTCQTPNKQNCVGTWRLTVPQLNRPMHTYAMQNMTWAP